MHVALRVLHKALRFVDVIEQAHAHAHVDEEQPMHQPCIAGVDFVQEFLGGGWRHVWRAGVSRLDQVQNLPRCLRIPVGTHRHAASDSVPVDRKDVPDLKARLFQSSVVGLQ